MSGGVVISGSPMGLTAGNSCTNPSYEAGWYTAGAGSTGWGPFWGPLQPSAGDLQPEVGSTYFGVIPGTGYGIDNPYPGYNHDIAYPSYDYPIPESVSLYTDFQNNLTATVVAGQKYTATVAVGHPTGMYTSPAYTIELLTAAHPAAYPNNTGNAAAGWTLRSTSTIAAGTLAANQTWTDLSTSFNSTAADAGSSMEILFTVNNFMCEGGTNTVYGAGALNNVRLSYTTAAPEPGTMALLATGLVSLLAYARRKSRRTT